MPSRGVALVERGRTLFGHEAAAQSRLHPRQTHNEFWQRLNADPVTPPGRNVANQADLVYLQLGAIFAAAGMEERQRADIVVAAPSIATPAQLGLLLGIAKEAAFDVSAVVGRRGRRDFHSAARRQLPLRRHHHAPGFVTQLDIQNGDAVARGTVEDVPAAGFAALLEGWVDAVADTFVESTRFDPLRIAATEQQVFDQLIGGIDANQSEIPVAVEHDGVSREVVVSRRVLEQKSRQRYGILATAIGAPATVLLSDRVRRLPGLAAALQEAGHRIVALPADAVAAGAERHAPALAADAGGARLVSSLPLTSAPAQTATDRGAHPTHLLCGALALPLADEVDARDHPATTGGGEFRIRRDGAGFSVAADADAPVLFNGEPLDFHRPVFAGDRIDSGGDRFQLIAVVDG